MSFHGANCALVASHVSKSQIADALGASLRFSHLHPTLAESRKRILIPFESTPETRTNTGTHIDAMLAAQVFEASLSTRSKWTFFVGFDCRAIPDQGRFQQV